MDPETPDQVKTPPAPELMLLWPRRLRFAYRAALISVAVVSIVAQFFIQYHLYSGEQTGETINLAGRQRMLSENMAKLSLLAMTANDAESFGQYQQQLAAAQETWRSSHISLEPTAANQGRAEIYTAEVQSAFVAIKPEFEEVNAVIDRLTEYQAPSLAAYAEDVGQLTQVALTYRQEMNDIVYLMSANAARSVNRLRIIEAFLLLGVLILLFVEARWVFRPAISKLESTLRMMMSTLAQLARSRDQALAAARSKAAFLANISHEVRTPLNGIMGLSELLRDSNLSQEQRSTIDSITSAGSHLQTILNDTLDYSRLEAGRFEIVYRDFHLPELLNSIVSIMRSSAADKKLEFNYEEVDLPEVVHSDPARIRQILDNLLSNAVKYTNSGHVSFRVKADLENTIEFVIEDSGIGMKQDYLDRIFEQFSREVDDGDVKETQGTGLGMAIVKQLVEALAGTIRIDSEVSRGTTVTLKLPVQVSGAVIEQVDLAQSLEFDSRSIQVLVADDDLVNLKVAQGHLRALDVPFDTANDGEQALAAMHQRRYDLVFMDVHMPVMDGLSATRKIREEYGKDVLVIGLTAGVLREDQSECLEAGMDDVLIKPYRRADMIAKLNTWFGQKAVAQN